jgi:hypothetical protein
MYDLPDGDLIRLRHIVEERNIIRVQKPSNSEYNNVAQHKKLHLQDFPFELNNYFS